jgi:hypothetical protein
MVTVQLSFGAKAGDAVSVNVVGPPDTVAVWLPLPVQAMVNHAPATFTGSLKVTLMVALVATPTAPAAGTVVVTAGALSEGQVATGLAELRGVGSPAAKSAPF